MIHYQLPDDHYPSMSMTDEPKSIPELAAGLVSPEYAAEHPLSELRPVNVETARLPLEPERTAAAIGAAFDKILSPHPDEPNADLCRRWDRIVLARQLIQDIGQCNADDPKVFNAVRSVLVDWFASWEKGGLSLCRALGLVDDGELEDWAHDHGWKQPD